jgi:hypothetical protein
VRVHCGIYKSSYNISNISYLNSLPSPFSFISLSAHSWSSFVGSGDLRQMSEHPIPHGEHCDSCILRRTCKPAFLHPEVQICHRADEQNALKISPPPTRGKTNQFTQESPRIHANEKSPPNPHPNPELKVHKKPSLHLSSELPLSGPRCTALAVAFPFSLINPTSYTSFGSQVNQLPHEPVL